MAAKALVDLSGAEKDELLCTYAALALHDEECEITAELIKTMIDASGNSVEAYWPTLFAKVLAKQDISAMLSLGGGGGGAGGAGTAGATGGDAAAGGDDGAGGASKQAAPEEEEDEMDFDLFD